MSQTTKEQAGLVKKLKQLQESPKFSCRNQIDWSGVSFIFFFLGFVFMTCPLQRSAKICSLWTQLYRLLQRI